MLISIYEDGAASFSGIKAMWSGIDANKIRLEVADGDETIIAELELEGKDSEGDRTATYSLAGLRTECEELTEEPIE